MANHEIVILGLSFAAITGLRIIVKDIVPLAKAKIHVTIVAPNTETFWCVASPRVLSQPELLDSGKLFFSVAELLKPYNKDISLVSGMTTSVDAKSNTVVVSLNGNAGQQTLKYDSLIIATGARTENPAFKMYGGEEESKQSLRDLIQQVEESKTIAIGGSGSVSVEVAGELGFKYGASKDIAIYSASDKILSSLNEGISKTALKQLNSLHVKFNANKYIKSVSKNASGKSILTFNDGSSVKVDTYIPGTGLTPNTSFLDQSFLDDNGYLQTDKHLRSTVAPNIYGIGDVLASADKTLISLDMIQKGVLRSTLKHDLVDKSASLNEFKSGGIIIAVPISKNGGVGQLFGFSVPNFVIKRLKSGHYLIPKAPEAIGII